MARALPGSTIKVKVHKGTKSAPSKKGHKPRKKSGR